MPYAATRGFIAFTLFSLLASCLQVSSGGAQAAPAASPDVEKRTADDLWDELTEGEGKAENHDHWERIVRRSARHWNDPYYSDDTQHIVDVQEYYRQVLEEQDWSDAQAEEELARLMQPWNDPQGPYGGYRANVQNNEPSEDVMREVQKPIPGRYIVMLDSSADDSTLDKTIAILQHAHAESEGRIRADHITAMRSLGVGFTATMNSKTVELMKKHPFLEVMEEDVAVKRSFPYVTDIDEAEIQHSSIPWNLDRLDQHDAKLDGRYEPEGDGNMASIYIIDTGVRYTHHEFEGRAKYAGFDAIDKLTGSNRQGADCQGHGTHCGGTAAGKTYGVAKKATIYSLRALGCSGSGAVSGIVEGMDFIAKNMQNGVHSGPVVFSMSLGVKESITLNTAIQRATNRGILAVSAAGNQGGDSCNYSPASARVGIAVGAVDRGDNMVSFSNAGECTDIYAPGRRIRSATSGCDSCTKTLSGTSMAAPHVAGYMGIILSLNPQMTAAEAKEKMIKHSTKDAVGLAAISSSLALRTPNRLLYVPQATAQDSDLSQMAHVSSLSFEHGRP